MERGKKTAKQNIKNPQQLAKEQGEKDWHDDVIESKETGNSSFLLTWVTLKYTELHTIFSPGKPKFMPGLYKGTAQL